MGPRTFLDQQLRPEKIDDSAIETRVAQPATLSMSNEELAENFRELRAERLEQQRSGQAALPSDQASRDPRMRSATSLFDSRPQDPLNGKPGRSVMMNGDGMWPGGTQNPRQAILELAQEELLRAVYSNRQLQEEMVQFWMNHFNIFAPKGADKWLLTSYERDTIRPHVMGKFEDLLVATADSPAMLFYLDNWLSTTPNPVAVNSPGFRKDQPALPLGGGFGVGHALGRGPLGQAAVCR